jgi:hypothetical protein
MLSSPPVTCMVKEGIVQIWLGQTYEYAGEITAYGIFGISHYGSLWQSSASNYPTVRVPPENTVKYAKGRFSQSRMSLDKLDCSRTILSEKGLAVSR